MVEVNVAKLFGLEILWIRRRFIEFSTTGGPVVFWLPLSKVTICDQWDDVDDDIAIYYEIRNQDENQMVRAMRER